jgi:SAM-dependent methyltransferase
MITPQQVPALGRRFAWTRTGGSHLTKEARDAREAVWRKLTDGVYRFEERACFCGNSEAVLLSTTDYYGFYYPFVACPRCGLLRANPRMTEKSYADFYDAEYRAAYGEDDSRLDQYFEPSLIQGKSLHKWTTEQLDIPSSPKVVFEIGCNMGAMLVPWKEAGCDVYGVDYNRRRIEYGKQRTGIGCLYVGGIEQLGNTGRKADLIVLHHVLEHFVDLDQALAQIRNLTNPGAHIYVALPGTMLWIKQNCNGDIMSLLQNAHTYQFTLATLRYVMGCYGFQFVSGTEEIVSLFKRTETFKRRENVPAGEFDRVMQYLRRRELMFVPKRYLKTVLDFLGMKDAVKTILRRIRR